MGEQPIVLLLSAQLLHQGNGIHLHPVLHDLAVRDPVNDHAGHDDLLDLWQGYS